MCVNVVIRRGQTSGQRTSNTQRLGRFQSEHGAIAHQNAEAALAHKFAEIFDDPGFVQEELLVPHLLDQFGRLIENPYNLTCTPRGSRDKQEFVWADARRAPPADRACA